jgi:Asp-tRNA(Asn)/Glu-tRNA(Gln) amidotransferase A subunit family amidase
MNEELYSIDATEAVERIKNKEIKVIDLIQSCLDRIEKVDQVVEAWAFLEPEKMIEKAEKIDSKLVRGVTPGPLVGIPIGVKDIFNTYDMPTQMGSPIWKDFTPGNDARVVHYLRMAQAVVLGKTITAEFAVHTPGPTRNPHNPAYMAGTSSTGSAVAVAASMVPLSLGTQTAGSTIRPASYTGVFGFKPSFGLLPRTAMLKTTDSLDTVGMFARSVRDLRLIFEVMRVKGVDYPIQQQVFLEPERLVKSGTWQVRLVKGPKWSEAEPYVRDKMNTFAACLDREKDINVDEFDLPSRINAVHKLHGIIYDRTLAYYFQEEFKQETLVSQTMYEIIRRGNEISLDAYKEALEMQFQITRELDQYLVDNEIDILLDISTGGEALEGLDSLDRPDHCLIWTFCGTPAINLPVFSGPNRLPFGAQIVSRRYNDYLLLSFAENLNRMGLIPDATNPPLSM